MNSRIKKIAFGILAILTVVITSICIFAYTKVDQAVNSMQSIDKKEIKQMVNENLSEETLTQLKDTLTVAVFGLDSRDGEIESGANSDVIIIASINNKTGEIKMASIYRDTCLKTGDDRYRKVNEAYAIGGPKKAVAVLSENLDLQIDEYITVNWASVATAINILGGIDADISTAEMKYINGYITETVNSTGIGSFQLKQSGLQHLDGIQAVAHCRIRYTDNDFKRTERQREVIGQMLSKAKTADWATINNIIVTVLPTLSTSFDTGDVIALGRNILKYNLSETSGFPFTHVEKTVDKQAFVFADDLTSNVSELHKFLYGTENYQPSKMVQSISEAVSQKMKRKEYSSSNVADSVPDPVPVTETEAYVVPEPEAADEAINESEPVEPISETMEMESQESIQTENYGPGYVTTEPIKEEDMQEETVEYGPGTVFPEETIMETEAESEAANEPVQMQ